MYNIVYKFAKPYKMLQKKYLIEFTLDLIKKIKVLILHYCSYITLHTTVRVYIDVYICIYIILNMSAL